jgi:hypothetical protein
MNGFFLSSAIVSVTAAALLAGCGHKTDAKNELEKTMSVLATGEDTNSAPAPAPAPEPQSPAPIESAMPVEKAPEVAAPSPARQMQQALASYKTGELEDAVTRLQKLRTAPTLTAQQRMAVQDSVAAVMSEIYQMAEKGNPRAIQAVKQYEEMQTSRH